MFDVVRDILGCLVLASLLGAASGWLVRGVRDRRRAQDELTRTGRAQALLEAQLSAAQQASRSGAARLTEAETARDAAKSDAEGFRTSATAAETRLSDVEGQREALRRENAELAAKASRASAATRQQLETLRATLKAAESGWDTSRAQAEAAHEQLALLRGQLDDTENERNALSVRLTENQALLLELSARLDANAEDAVQWVSAEAEAPPPTPALEVTTQAPAPALEHDDLQAIRGIGPVLEKTLHELGVHRYAQIALWTREDVHSMQERLPGFHGRIMRDNWPAAATRLHIAKYGSPP